MSKCPACQGSKIVKRVVGETFVEATCPYCCEEGAEAKQTCPVCKGSHVQYDEETSIHRVCRTCRKVKEPKKILLEG